MKASCVPPKAKSFGRSTTPIPISGQDLDPELVFIRNDMKGDGQRLQSRSGRRGPLRGSAFPVSDRHLGRRWARKTKITELVRTADRLSGTIDVDKLQASRC